MRRQFVVGCMAVLACAPLGGADVPRQDARLGVKIDVDLVQAVAGRSATYLFVELSLENQAGEELKFSAAHIRLRVGDESVAHSIPEADDRTLSVVSDPNESETQTVEKLPWFDLGVLPAAQKRTGWLCFNLTTLGYIDHEPSIFARPHWWLTVDAPGRTGSLDLKSHEVRALDVRRRPSRFDPSVPVIEIGSRLNSLNVDALEQVVDDVLSREAGYVMVFKRGTCLIEELVARRFDNRHGRWSFGEYDRVSRVVVRSDDEDWRLSFFGFRESADSEAAATVMILARRPGAAPALIKFLDDDAPDVRLAAAKALGPHLASQVVRDALARATRRVEGAAPPMPRSLTRPARGRFPRAARDPASEIRSAAIHALGYRTVTTAQGRGPDSADTLAIVAALGDRDASVRHSATLVAEGFPYPNVAEQLMRLLDEPAEQGLACHALASLRHHAAKEKLEWVRTHGEPRARAAAIEALEVLGVMSHSEALFAKLDAGQLSQKDCEYLVELKDPRSIPKLLALAKDAKNAQAAALAIEMLRALPMPQTVEPLIELLNAPAGVPPWRGARFHGEQGSRLVIVKALAALGDPRAIRPIFTALQTEQSAPLEKRLAFFDALLRLQAPGALTLCERFIDFDDAIEVDALLKMLGGHNDAQVLPLFERFLHTASFAASAAEMLSYLSIDGAEQALVGCLKQVDHRLRPRWVGGVARNPLWLAEPKHQELVDDTIRQALAAAANDADERTGQGSRGGWLHREILGDAGKLKTWFLQANRHPAGAIECRVDRTQDGFDCLLLRLSLVNHTSATLRILASEFALEIDGEFAAAMRIMPGVVEPPAVRDATINLKASALSYWSDVVLPPGAAAQGWVAFETARAMRALRRGTGKPARTWTVWIKAGEAAVAFDLLANELRAFDVDERRSSFDDSLRVVEVMGRLNCVNAASFMKRLQALSGDEPGYIVSLDTAVCDLGPTALEKWETWLTKHCQPDAWPVGVVGKLPPRHGWLTVPGGMRSFWTEELAAIALLDRRPEAGSLLVKHLCDDRPEIRAAAAAALKNHVAEEGVAEALADVFDDVDPAVRWAAVQAIADPKQPLPAHLLAEGSPIEAAVLAALDSPDDQVHNSATMALQWFPSRRVEQTLLDLLDASPHGSLACYSLGKLQSKAAVEKLKRFVPGDDYAVDALRAIGELSAVEAVLAKLDAPLVAPRTFTEAGQVNDPRVIAKLIELLQKVEVGFPFRSPHRNFRPSLEALLKLHAKEAVEPLAALLVRPDQPRDSRAILNALAELDDQRAVERIRQALRTAPPDWRERMWYHVALARLNDPQALVMLRQVLKQPLPRNDTWQLLWELTHSGRDELIMLAERLLDDQRVCGSAADFLAHSGSAQALAALRRRLVAADYPLAAETFQGLQRADWLLSPVGQELVRDILRGDNTNAKQLAEAYLSDD